MSGLSRGLSRWLDRAHLQVQNAHVVVRVLQESLAEGEEGEKGGVEREREGEGGGRKGERAEGEEGEKGGVEREREGEGEGRKGERAEGEREGRGREGKGERERGEGRGMGKRGRGRVERVGERERGGPGQGSACLDVRTSTAIQAGQRAHLAGEVHWIRVK